MDERTDKNQYMKYLNPLNKWIPVTGYEGIYMIRSDGKVKGLRRTTAYKSTEREIKSKEFKFTYHSDGYIVALLTKDNIGKRLYLHRLLALHFIPNPENKPQVNHKNGIKHDNRLVNLEWVTVKENIHHAIRTGLTILPPGFHKKPTIQFDINGVMLNEFSSALEASEKTGIGYSLIRKAASGAIPKAAGYKWKYKNK